MESFVAAPHPSETPDGNVPEEHEIDCPTAAQLGYPEHTVEVTLPDWADGNVVQFGGPAGIEIDRNGAIGVVDVCDWV